MTIRSVSVSVAVVAALLNAGMVVANGRTLARARRFLVEIEQARRDLKDAQARTDAVLHEIDETLRTARDAEARWIQLVRNLPACRETPIVFRRD